jgi:hypothetical protein
MSPEQLAPRDPQHLPATLSPQLPLQQSSSASQKLPSERHVPQVPMSSPYVLQILLQHSLSALQLAPSDTQSTQVQLEGSNFCPEGQVVETQLPPHSVVPVGHWHTPLTHTRPSGQQVTLVPVPQTRASGQHVPLTQVSPVGQHPVPQGVVPLVQSHSQVEGLRVRPDGQLVTQLPPQGVVPDGQAAHVPLTQLLLQHSSWLVQDTPFGVHGWLQTPAPHSCPSGQQVTLVPVPQTRALGQHVLPISVVPLGHSHRQVSELTAPPSQPTHWSPHGKVPGSSHWHNPSTQLCASPLQQMAKAPVPQTFAVGQQTIPCKQVSSDGQHWVPQTRALGQHVPFTQVVSPVLQQATLVAVPQGVLSAGQAAHLRLTQLPLQHCWFFLHFFPVGLHSSSAAASPMPRDASAPPTSAAPINLSTLPRERVPLAIPLVSSSKECSLASGDMNSPSSRKGGTRQPRRVI